MTIAPTSETSHGGTDPIRCSIEALFEALETPLLGYAFRLVQSGDLAQDLVQEAFLRLHHHWESVREPKPWLFQTVHHLAVSHIRKSSRLRQLDATKEGVDASMDPSGNPFQLPDEWIAHQEALGLVRLTLDGLRFIQENVDRFANDNSDDVNVAFNLQAERIIQQQEAASETAERLRASFPEIGHTYTFEQSLQFEDWSSLELSVEARLSHLTVGWGMRMGFVFLSLGALWVGLLMTSALTRYGR